MDIHVDRDLVVELTCDLVRLRSINPPGNEHEVATFLHKRLVDLGLEAEIDQVEPQRSNLLGRLPGGDQGHLVLTGHLDVVPPGGQQWQHPPFDPTVEDGRIYGRGSCDMKGGVAALVTAMAALKSAGFQPRADIVLAATMGEEAGMTGARAMVSRNSLKGARYLVVAEPSNLNVFVGEKGVLWTKIRALGRTAHGSMPTLGVNAVSYMARLIPRLEAYPFASAQSDLLGSPTLSVNVIEGGNKTNVVPDVCEIEVDMRTLPDQDNGALIEELRHLAETVAADFHPDLRVEVEVDQNMPSVETDASDPLVTAMVDAVSQVRGRPEVGGVPYGTDAAALGPGFGIPMVICGPGDQGMAHQPDEYVEIEQLVQAAEIYARLAVTLLG